MLNDCKGNERKLCTHCRATIYFTDIFLVHCTLIDDFFHIHIHDGYTGKRAAPLNIRTADLGHATNDHGAAACEALPTNNAKSGLYGGPIGKV